MKSHSEHSDYKKSSASGEMPVQNQDLIKERREILSLPPEEALDKILSASQPKLLVQSFSEEDFNFLINGIGTEDSLPILALASYEQWEFILDLETWDKDRVQNQSLTHWIKLLLAADTTRLIYWMNSEKKELLEHYLSRNIEVIIRETDQDPSELGKDILTFDDNYYFRILDTPIALESSDAVEKEKRILIKQLLDRIAEYDHQNYIELILESSSIVAAETEEELYRKRNVRLAEKGFLPFDEAIGVYQPLTKAEFDAISKKYASTEADAEETMPVPVFMAEIFDDDSLFASALKQIASQQMLQQLQAEFAGLCNRLIVADQKSIHSKSNLPPVVQKASNYLSLGLTELTAEIDEPQISRSIQLIQEYPLYQIFRVGYGLVLALKWRAEKWNKEAWFEKQRLDLSFWGEAWLGVLGGLLIKKPLYFNNYRSGSDELYREFSTMQDIVETEAVLDEIIAFDHLLSLVFRDTLRPPKEFVTYKSLVLTCWARQALILSEGFNPIPLVDFKRFLEQLYLPQAAVDEANIRTIDPSMKDGFFNWLVDESGMASMEISQKLGNALEILFEEIQTELGGIDEDNLDPKFIQLFRVAPS